jgi:hypothetical protein
VLPNRRSSGDRRAALAAAPPEATIVGGRYRVEKQLGSGGMAKVWQVHDAVGDRPLALKRLSRHADRRLLALFEREYYTLTGLEHPNIIEVYDYAADSGGPYYTMELLRGSDVSTLAPAPWLEVCRVLRDVASALALLHARRYIHRDVSARNVWMTGEGRVKLIDFGTLTSFGRARDIAGTPPYLPPEALHGGDLDQRTDLYALGALGYQLLTGRHAFAVRSLQDLPDAWDERPRPASQRVAELGRSDLPPIPAALDQLLESLLASDMRARPMHAAEVIDALCAVAGFPVEAQPLVEASYLKTPALAGRGSQLQLLRDAFLRADTGRGAAVVIESAPGMGRTRLIEELALQARLAGAVVLRADPDAQTTHGAAEQFAHKLLDELPELANRAAQAYAPVLGHLSQALRARLGVNDSELMELPKTHGEARMRVQAALCDWFLEVARARTLVLLADDFHDHDSATVAWLAALGRAGKASRILIVTSVSSEAPQASTVLAVHRHATLLTLPPLTAADVEEMLQGIFGRVSHVARLADLVYQRSEGNPGRALDFVLYLVQHELAKYVEGAWVLPTSIAESQLPASEAGVLAARLQRLPPAARSLAQVLSVADGLISFELCAALADMPSAQTYEALEALSREDVLAATSEGYRFAREPLRLALLHELDGARRERAHRITGQLQLTAAKTPLERLQAGLHLLLGGDVERGTSTTAVAALHYGLVDLADVGQAAPAIERALALFLKLERPPHELLCVYAPLALAGYYAERHYADRYTEAALALLQDLVGLTRAKQLRPRIGRHLSLAAGMGEAAVAFHKHRDNPRVPSYRQAIQLLFYCVAASTGVCTVCIDPKRAQRYADILEPMRALGRDHVATLMHDFCCNLASTVRDSVGESSAQWQRLIERLDSQRPIRDLPPEVRILYLAGALYASGVMECWRDSSKALLYAQRLEDFKLRLYELSANQLRMMYYAHRGDFERAERYRERVELHAIQRGSAWQVETWTYVAMMSVYARTHNAIGVKHCAQQVERLSHEVPSLRFAARRTYGTYLLLRGSPEEALPFLMSDDEPLAVAGWSRSRSMLAAALNQLGRYEEARSLCLHVLSFLTPADLAFPALNLEIQLQLALAEAGLGNLQLAADQLDALIQKHLPNEGPLTLCALYETRAEVAVAMHDINALEIHLMRMQHWRSVTGDRSLIVRGERFAASARVRALGAPALEPEQASAALVEEHALTVVHRLRFGGARDLSGSAEWIMERLAEYADIRAGHVFLWRDDEPITIASRGEMPEPAVFEDWLRARLGPDLDQTTVHLEPNHDDPDRFTFRGRSYRLQRLYGSGPGAPVVGVLLLSEETLFRIPPKVLQVIADRLLAGAAHDTAHVTDATDATDATDSMTHPR